MKPYYNQEDLSKFSTIGEESPKLWENFMKYYTSVLEEQTLTAREKTIIALAVSHAIHCPYCIDSYTQECLNKGINQEQMTEAIHIAAAIKAGATLAHGLQMKNVVKSLEF